MASPEGDQLLARDFHGIMDIIQADIIHIPKKWN